MALFVRNTNEASVTATVTAPELKLALAFHLVFLKEIFVACGVSVFY